MIGIQSPESLKLYIVLGFDISTRETPKHFQESTSIFSVHPAVYDRVVHTV